MTHHFCHKNDDSVESGDMREGGVRKPGKMGDVTYMDDPYLKLLCKKHNDQNHVFCCERCFTHPHVRVQCSCTVDDCSLLNNKRIKVIGRCSIHTKLF